MVVQTYWFCNYILLEVMFGARIA